MAMNIQIFGTNKSFDTKKAQRWFKERGIRFQMIDMKEKGMSRGEFDNVCRAVGGWAKLVDENAKDKDTLALLKWLDESQQADKLFENQQLFRQPIVRNGRQATVGYCPEVWEKWEYDRQHASLCRSLGARQICAPALDKSAALRYIIRYKCSAKECARVVPLQQAGEDASPVRCGGCCHFQAGAVRGASPLPAAHGVAAVIRAGGLVGLPQSGPIGQLGWYRDLSFSGRPMINSWGGLFYFVQM